jgi:hypothetical protein
VESDPDKDREIEVRAACRAARIVAEMLAQLPATPGGEAVARFLLDDRDSIRTAARRIGCAPSSLSRAERQFLRFIGLCNTPLLQSKRNEKVI